MSIEDWRDKINEIDGKLVKLLNERTQCVIEIGKIKKVMNMRVYDPDRERDVIQRVRQANRGPLDDEGLQHVFERIIDECRRIERRESEKAE